MDQGLVPVRQANAAACAIPAAALQAALDSVGALELEALQAKAMAERHQEMVASLTADNLMFVMRLKQCEGELLSTGQERDELRLAVDEQKGPWFDEVWTALTLLGTAQLSCRADTQKRRKERTTLLGMRQG